MTHRAGPDPAPAARLRRLRTAAAYPTALDLVEVLQDDLRWLMTFHDAALRGVTTALHELDPAPQPGPVSPVDGPG